MNKEDVFYQAMLARDHRFDGKFFVGVKTTGIYCRPICPAKPKRQNVEFFTNHIAAETAGYRPCLRCRPESAPLSPAWIGKSAIVQRAVKILHNQETTKFNEDRFANLFGVSARHLRRVFIAEIGKTPKQLSFENRLNLARKLLVETQLPITEIVFASGFNSVRRFNDAFKDRFKKSPSEIRRHVGAKGEGLKISMPYRPPFDYKGLLYFYGAHRTGSLEWIEEEKLHRIVAMNGHVGKIVIANDANNSQLQVEIDFPDSSMIHAIISRVRAMFDLDSDPLVIANCLEADPKMKAILKKHTGIRLPSGWDPFEVAIATILGQLVSVDRGRSLVADLIEMLGTDSGYVVDGRRIKLFPSPKQIAESKLDGLKTTRIRKQTLIDFSKMLLSKKLSLEATQDVQEFYDTVTSIKGIGPWSANYMSMKVLRNTDSFPATDLILARTLTIHSPQVIEKMSPWRSYVASLFWREYSSLLTRKTK